MDYRVAIEWLTDAFITHELKIRREPLNRSTMRSRKERLLAILLREERTQAQITYFTYLDSASDLTECRQLFNLAKADMETDLSANAEKVEIQLIFLKERIFRVATNNEHDINMRSLLLIEIETLQREFNNFSVSNVELPPVRRMNINANDKNEIRVDNNNNVSMNNSMQQPITSSPINNNRNAALFREPVVEPQINGNIIDNNSHFMEGPIINPFAEHREQPLINIGHVPSYTSCPHTNCSGAQIRNNAVSPTRSGAQVWKWGIKFSSSDKTKSASEFMQRIKDLARSRNVTSDELLAAMPELLEGTAAQWFRTNSHSRPFQSFDDFELRFLGDFEPYHRVDTRLELLKKRLQKNDENIVTFFAYVENEFLMMAFRPCEAEQVKIIRRNLLPQYIHRLSLESFNTVHELKEACKKIELSSDIIKYQNVHRINNLANSGPLRFSGLQYSRNNQQMNQGGQPIEPVNPSTNNNTGVANETVFRSEPPQSRNGNIQSVNGSTNGQATTNSNGNTMVENVPNQNYRRNFNDNRNSFHNRNQNMNNSSYANFQNHMQTNNRSNYRQNPGPAPIQTQNQTQIQNSSSHSQAVSVIDSPAPIPTIANIAHSTLNHTELLQSLLSNIGSPELVDTDAATGITEISNVPVHSTSQATEQIIDLTSLENSNGVPYGEMETPLYQSSLQ